MPCRAGDIAGGLSRRPPDPLRVPAALAVVLSGAGGCCRGARPELRAIGDAGIVIPAEAMQGAPPPASPPERQQL